MKRRTREETSTGLILPVELVDVRGLTADQFRIAQRRKRRWFLARGINPADWSAVYPILRASRQAYGIPSAADSARLRLKPADERQHR